MTIQKAEHAKRVITGVLGLVLLATLYYYLGIKAVVLFTIFVGLGAYFEFLQILLSPQNSPSFRTVKIGIALSAGVVMLLPFERSYFGALLILMIFTLGIYRFRETNPQTVAEHRFHLDDLFVAGFGLFYIIGFLRFLPEIHRLDSGASWLLLLIGVIWVGDTAAYYGGHTFGKHKLAYVISPGKTLEGSFFGLLGSLAVGWAAHAYTLSQYSLGKILVVTVVTGAISQMGDLFESLLKRISGVKDSGFLLPGHGGMLDRFDSLILAGPFYYFLLRLWIV